ncbi:MAG: LysR family transcriptional regulator [Pseudomonadota bacterium]
MSLPPVPLSKLVTLEVLLRTESVSDTARQLRRTQPSVTAILGELRQHFGDRLLVRDGARMRRTAFATRLLPRLEAFALDARDVLALRPAFEPASDHRRFQIAATDYQAALIAEGLARAIQAAPCIEVDLRPIADCAEAVRRGAVSFAMLTGPEPDAALAPRLVRSDPFYLIYDPAMRRPPRSREAFAACDFVQAAPSGIRGGLVDTALAAYGLTRQVRITVGPLALAARLVEGTAALSVLPESLARASTRDGRLAQAALPLEIPPARTWLAVSPRSGADPATRRLADHLCGAAP